MSLPGWHRHQSCRYGPAYQRGRGRCTLRWRGLSLRFAPQPVAIVSVLALVTAGLAVDALGRGSEAIPLARIAAYLGVGAWPPDPAQLLVLDAFRAPRILLAILVGAMLALAGAVMQQLTRNGLADPGLLGVREGAALLIVTAMLLFPGHPLWWRPALGMLGGLAAGLVTLVLARGASGLRFVMLGVGLSWFLATLLLIVLTMAETGNLQSAMIWLAGNLQGADWQAVALAALLLVPAFALLLALAPAVAIEGFGPELATSLGLRRRPLNLLRFALSVFLVAGAVSVAGSLGFVGLIAPHLARALPGGSPRASLIATALIGAILVLAADTLGRTAFAPVELPTGIMLSALGAPVLIALLWARRNRL